MKISYLGLAASIAFNMFIDNSLAETPATIKANYIYQITSDQDHPFVAYIFGSNHFSPSNIPIHLDQCVKNIISSADQIYIEGNQFDAIKLLQEMKGTMSMRLVSGKIDRKILTSINNNIFNNSERDDFSKLNSLDAHTVLSTVQSRIPGSQIFGQLDYGLDTEIIMAGLFLNKKIGYIESAYDQIGYLSRLTPENYARAIEISFELASNSNRGVDFNKEKMELLISTAIGDESRIISYIRSSSFRDYEKITILDRNESISNKVSEILTRETSKNIFIALGALHLAGVEGVPQLLKSKGYAVKRLCQ